MSELLKMEDKHEFSQNDNAKELLDIGLKSENVIAE